MIGNKEGPLPVPADTIASLKIMITSDLPVATGSRLKKGDKVVVVSGPFVGLSGIFVRYRGKGRVVVNIDALGQFAGVEVREEDVEKAPAIIS